MNDDNYTSYRDKIKIDGGLSKDSPSPVNTDELIDFIAEMIGNRLSCTKVKIASEIAFDCALSDAIVARLMAIARKRITDAWNRPADEFRGTILQGIANDLSDPKLSRNDRIRIHKLLILLGQQIPDDKLASEHENAWAKKTPDEIINEMDDLTVEKKDA